MKYTVSSKGKVLLETEDVEEIKTLHLKLSKEIRKTRNGYTILGDGAPLVITWCSEYHTEPIQSRHYVCNAGYYNIWPREMEDADV